MPSDLNTFVDLVRCAKRKSAQVQKDKPVKVLRALEKTDDCLHRSELARLERSLKIAYVAGDLQEPVHQILHAIVQELDNDAGSIYLPLTRSDEWLSAIAWALFDLESSPPISSYLPQLDKDRPWVVGNACRALRDRGYGVEISVLGPHIDSDTRFRIAKKVNLLIAQMGGIATAKKIFRTLRDNGKLHADMWLFGNVPTRYDQQLKPAVPFGWLLSLALKNVNVSSSSADPAKTWKSLVELAIDFAASADCQRYNPFDGMFPAATDFTHVLTDSLAWREFFTLPQVPPLVLPTIQEAFSQIEWPNGTDDLRSDVDQLFGELRCLLKRLCNDRLTLLSKDTVNSEYPLLVEHGCAPQSGVNTEYFDIFSEYPRDQDRYVFFEASDGRLAVLPPSLTAANGCEAIFRHVWDKARKDAASKIVGNVIEKSVAIGCRAHTQVWEKEFHSTGRRNFEIDLAVREDREIVLFESKAKSLTSKARAGDLIAIIDDYTKSILTLLKQLVRHDRNIKRGRTPLTRDDDDLDALRIVKVAVSPLSYGPASDPVLNNALIRSIANFRLDSVNGNTQQSRILNAFNKSVRDSIEIISQIAPQREGKVDIRRYLMCVSWWDLGQLLYVLHRGNSVTDAVSALKHVTFSTQDFWTEVAFAELQGHTHNKWQPIPKDKLPR